MSTEIIQSLTDACINVIEMYVSSGSLCSTTSMTFCMFGYKDDVGVDNDSFMMLLNQTSNETKVIFPRQQRSIEQIDCTNIKDIVFQNILKLIGNFSIKNYCVCFNFSPDTTTHDGLYALQNDMLRQIKREMWRGARCKYTKGPRLDNKDIQVTPALSRSKTITFTFYPPLLSRYYEVVGDGSSQSIDEGEKPS